MRCRACDVELNDIESTRKDPQTGEFYDLCGGCLSEVRRSQYEDNEWPDFIEGLVSDDKTW